jgi:hypothetical protein
MIDQRRSRDRRAVPRRMRRVYEDYSTKVAKGGLKNPPRQRQVKRASFTVADSLIET